MDEGADSQSKATIDTSQAPTIMWLTAEVQRLKGAPASALHRLVGVIIRNKIVDPTDETKMVIINDAITHILKERNV